jgi:hypothetical protein
MHRSVVLACAVAYDWWQVSGHTLGALPRLHVNVVEDLVHAIVKGSTCFLGALLITVLSRARRD